MADQFFTPIAHDPFAFTPVDHDPFATPKPGQQVPPVMNPDTMARDAARTVVDMARPFWMDMEPTDREIVERGSAMQTGQTGPGKVLPTTGMNPAPFAALDIGSMLPVGGIAKLAGAALGMGAKGALKAGAEAAIEGAVPKVGQGIRAYHGSPHDFERFDLSKIGTGEGAQAYGHGLYFAENEGVAKSYRDALDPKKRYLPQAVAREMQAGTPHDQIWSKLSRDPLLRSRTPQEIDNAIEFVKNNPNLNPGRMYEVNINANPEHFLDWDKPLSEQPKLHETVRNLVPADMRQAFDANVKSGISGANAYHNYIPSETYAIREPGATQYAASGAKTFDEALQMVGGDTSRLRTIRNPSKDAASEALRQAGIPGIKYLDQGSRQPKTLFNGQPIPSDNPSAQLAAEKLDLHGSPDKAIASLENDATQGHPYIRQSSADAAALLKNGSVARSAPQGTSNYVLFDDKLIDIVKKYGIAGLGIFPAGTNVLFPVDHDPFAQQGPQP